MVRVINQAREPRTRIALLTVMALVASVIVFGTFSNADASSHAVAGANFEIDGDLDQDAMGPTPPEADDWETVLAASGGGTLIPDNHSKSAVDESVFNSGGKFYDTSTWNIGTGNVGAAQNELTNVAVYPIPSSGDDWLVLALERTKKQGTFALWFELNQTEWDLSKASTPAREDGDIAVGFELSGNPETEQDFEIAVLVYDENGAATDKCSVNGDGTITPGGGLCPVFNGDWHYRFLGSAATLAATNIGAGEMNLGSIPTSPVPDWDSYTARGAPRDDIGAFQFAEAALNLTALGVNVGCPGFGSAHAASVASLSSTADAKDLGGPQALPISCSIEGTKFFDSDNDGAFTGESGLADWPIQLYKDSGDGEYDATDTQVASMFTCGQITTEQPTVKNECDFTLDDSTGVKTYTEAEGHYSFTGLSDGTYHVVEGDAPFGGSASNWLHVSSRSTDGTTVNDANGDPTIIEGIAINAANTTSTGNDSLNAQPPDIKVTKTAGQTTPYEAGDTIEFTIKVENLGPGAAQGVTLEDHLPVLDTTDAWGIKTGTPAETGVTCSIAKDDDPGWGSISGHDGNETDTQHLSCSTSTLAKDASFSVTIQAATTGDDCGTINNTAVGDATNEPDTSAYTTNNTDSASLTVNCPSISAAKSGTISYTASVTNASGSSVATADGVTLVDTLPGDLAWTVTAITDATKCTGEDAGGLEVDDTVPGNAINCSGIELNAGASFSVTVTATISDETSDCTTSVMIGNTVTGAASNEASTATGDNTDSAAVCAPAPPP